MPVDINEMTPLIQVFNMPRALAFYRDILGFQIVTDSGKGDHSSWVWLRLNGADLMLNDQYEPGHEPREAPPERTRWHEDTCLYFGCSDPDAAYEFLSSKGLDLKPPKVASYGMKQLYFSRSRRLRSLFAVLRDPTREWRREHSSLTRVGRSESRNRTNGNFKSRNFEVQIEPAAFRLQVRKVPSNLKFRYFEI